MAELVGGAALGAVFGAVFAVLHDRVKNVGSKVHEFKSVLTRLESKLDLLAPVVKEISLLNREEETKSLVEDMKKAEELIRIFSVMEGWTAKFQVHHSKRLTELEKAIENFCKVHMPAQTKRDTSQIKMNTSQILGNTSQILSQILGERAQISQILEDSSQIKQILEDAVSKILRDRSQISQILEETSQISQTIWEEFKEHKLKEKAEILLTPGQCSHTTSLEQHGRYVLIKGI
jgi:predicted transcriptional regulator